jgi:molybdate transport system substrate-binding protein
MGIHRLVWFLLILSALVSACAKEDETASESMTVFCGSASKPAMEEIAELFEQKTRTRVNVVFGGSGTLLSQIELSKQGEIYIPGSPDYIIIGTRKNLLIEKSDQILAYLVPAIITPAGNPAGIQTLEDLGRPGARVGIGNPRTVCLGLYGVELLERNGLLAKVMKNVVTFGGSCSKTANLAAMSQVDAILGWRVFHRWNPSRMTYVPIEPERIPRVSYIPVSIPVYTKDLELSKKMVDFLVSPAGRSVYERLGYITDMDGAKALAPQARVGGEYSLPDDYFDLLRNFQKQG